MLLLSSDSTNASRIETLLPPLSSISSTPWKARNAARVTTNDGMPTFATRKPSTRPMTRPVTSAAGMAQYQAAVVGQQDRHDRAADAAGEAGGQVDLAQQQDEDQAHRDEDDGGALGEQVREVDRAEEGRPDDAKTSAEHDQAEDGRQAPMSPPRTRPTVVADMAPTVRR